MFPPLSLSSTNQVTSSPVSSSASRQSDLSPALRDSRLILPALLLAGHCFFKQLEQSCTSMSSCRSCRTDLPIATELVTNSDEQAMTVLPIWACLGDSTVPAALNPAGGTCSPSQPTWCSHGAQTRLPGRTGGSQAAGLYKSLPEQRAQHCTSPTHQQTGSQQSTAPVLQGSCVGCSPSHRSTA